MGLSIFCLFLFDEVCPLSVPYQERNRLADLVKEETNTEDAIYAWDDTATLYRQSERLSPSAILSPLHYTATEENRNKLLNDLKKNNLR